MTAVGILLILTGAILLICALAQWLQKRSYSACSENVSATITRMRKRNVKNGVAYELTCAYTVDGTSYEKVIGVTRTEYEALCEGRKYELLYKPADPKRAVRPQNLNPNSTRILLLVGFAVTVVGVVLFLLGRA